MKMAGNDPLVLLQQEGPRILHHSHHNHSLFQHAHYLLEALLQVLKLLMLVLLLSSVCCLLPLLLLLLLLLLLRPLYLSAAPEALAEVGATPGGVHDMIRV
jgi:hypothetical protein